MTFARFSRRPRTKLSKMTISLTPSSTKRSAICDPIRPAPPVIKIRFFCMLRSRRLATVVYQRVAHANNSLAGESQNEERGEAGGDGYAPLFDGPPRAGRGGGQTSRGFDPPDRTDLPRQHLLHRPPAPAAARRRDARPQAPRRRPAPSPGARRPGAPRRPDP